MKIEVKKLPRGQVELTIELSVDEYQPFLEQAAKQISETTKIAGFRPGKASFEIIKQNIGLAEIWEKPIEPAIQKTLFAAINENKLITVGAPQVDIVKLAPENSLIYKAKVSLLPQVTLGEFKKIKINPEKIEVKTEEVKNAIERLQKMRAKEILVNRATQKGDKVEIDFETFMDKVPLERGQNQKFPLVIGENTFIPGFEDQLIGLVANQTKEFQLAFPQNYHQKNLAGRQADFKIKMNNVYQLDLPELNDEFAKSLGGFANVSAVEEKINQNLKDEAKFKENQKLEEKIIDALIENSKFEDIPDILIDSETKKMVEELEHNLNHQGLKFEDYLTHLKKSRADLLLDFVPQAIKRVKSAIVIRKIAETENIFATDAEIQTEMKNILAEVGGNPEIEQQIHEPAYKNYLQNILTTRKVIEYLKSVIVK